MSSETEAMNGPQDGGPDMNGTASNANSQAINNDKPWTRPWEPSELRQNASEWSLAADAGLLKYMQAFSAKFMAKAHESTLAINNLVHETNMTDATMRNVADRFLTLSDSQFIENRVYDEDVSEDANGDSKAKTEEEKKEEKKDIDPFPKLKEAIQSGLKVLEEAYDVLDANAVHSDYDSEDDSDAEDGQGVNGTPEHIYEPKDPYVIRPLPHLIGSRGFLESDDVGIKDLPSDDEEAQDDQGSISESDEEVEKPSTERKDSVTSSDYDSDTEYSDSEEEDKKNVRTESIPKKQKFSSESDEEDEDLFGEKSEDDFSDGEESPAEKKRSSSKVKAPLKAKKKKDKPKKQDADLFGDEEEGDDLFGNSGGLFGTGANLFDKKKKKGGLFDDADVSEEESDEASDQEEEGRERESDNKSQDLSSSEEEEDEKEQVPEKSSKPHGGVSLFGGALNKELLSKTRRESDSGSQSSKQSSKKASNLFLDEDDDDDDLFASKPPSKPKAAAQPKPQPKVKSILSDSDDDMKPPPMETKSSTKEKKTKPAADLFGSDSDDDLFGDEAPQKAAVKKPAVQKTSDAATKISSTPPVSKKKEAVKPTIFNSESSDDDSMFSKKPPKMEASSKPVSKSKGVFDSDSDDDFFADVKSKPTTKIAAERESKPVLESDSDDGDLFSSLPEPKKPPKVVEKPKKDVEDVERDEPTSKPKSNSLFDDDSEEQESEDEKVESPPQKKKPVGAVSMFGGALGGAELFAAVSKRRAVSEVSTKSSSSNDFEQPKESKKNVGLFDDDGGNEAEVKKEHPLPKVVEKPGETKPKPVIETPKPVKQSTPNVPVNVTAKPFKPFGSSPPVLKTDLLESASGTKSQPSANVTPKPFKPFGSKASSSKPDAETGGASPPRPSVSKLRTGLVIDPSALLPGAAPKPKPVVQVDISFDEPPVVKTLESVNKTRARGQRNRRPPSRHFKGNLVVKDEKSETPTFVEEVSKPEKKDEIFGAAVARDEPKVSDLPKKEDLPDISVKKPKEQPKNLIDSADLDDELFSGSLFTKSDKKSAKAKPAAPKLFDDDIFGDTDDFLTDLVASKKKDKGQGLKVVDLDDDNDIFGDLPSGGILSKPSKKAEKVEESPLFDTPKEKVEKEKPKLLDDDDIFGDTGKKSDKKQKKSDEDIFGDFADNTDAKSKSDPKTKKSKPIDDSDIFDDDDFDFSLPKGKGAQKEDLFGNDNDAPIGKSPKVEKKKPAAKKEVDIFGDNIFSDAPKKAAPKKTTAKKVNKKPKTSKSTAGTSIFDDDDDMSDIFASGAAKKKTKKPPSKTAVPKKVEEQKTTSNIMDDPLSMP